MSDYAANKELIDKDLKIALNDFCSQTEAIKRFIKHVDSSLDQRLGEVFKNKSRKKKLTFTESFNLSFNLYTSIGNDKKFIRNMAEKIGYDKTEDTDLDIVNYVLGKISEQQEVKFYVEEPEEGKYRLKFNLDSIEDNLKKYKINEKLLSLNSQFVTHSKDKETLYQSATITIANNVELLFSKLIHIMVKRNPGIMTKDKYSINYSDLSNMVSVEEAKDKMIENFMVDTMYGSLTEWLGLIKDKVKGKVQFNNYINEEDKNYLVDFFQKRNIIVHNNGIVNEIFLNNISDNLKKQYKIGDRIFVNKNNLIEELDNVFIIMIKLSFFIWKSIFNNEASTRFKYFHNEIGYEMLTEKSYKNAQKIFELILTEKDRLKLADRLMCEINHSQTYKWLGKEGKAKKLLQEIDFSIAPNNYLFSRSLIEENHENAKEYLEKIIGEDIRSSTPAEIVYFYGNWPIAKEFIKSSFFFDILDTYKLPTDVLEPYSEETIIENNNKERYNTNIYKKVNRKKVSHHDKRTRNYTRRIIKLRKRNSSRKRVNLI